MAFLVKQPGRNVWQCRIYNPKTGKVKSVSTGQTDKAKAEAIAKTLEMAAKGSATRDILVNLIDELLGHEAPNMRVMVQDIESAYFELPELDIKKSTKQSRRRHIRRFCKWMADTWPSVDYMDEVNRAIVMGFCDRLREQSLKNKTFNIVRSELQTVFEALTYRAGLKENPWKVVKNLKTTDSLSGRAFNRDEVTAILDACRNYNPCPEFYGASLLALYTGLRLADIKEIRWSDYDGQLIRLTPSKTEKHGITVMIPIHKRAKAWLDKQARTEGRIFAEIERRSRTHKNHGDFNRILERCELEAEGAYLSFHCWRHTWRTRLSESGAPKEIVQKMGGWKSDISESVYNHDFESMAKAIAGLD